MRVQLFIPVYRIDYPNLSFRVERREAVESEMAVAVKLVRRSFDCAVFHTASLRMTDSEDWCLSFNLIIYYHTEVMNPRTGPVVSLPVLKLFIT